MLKKLNTDVLASNMAQKLPKLMPAKLADKGITAKVEKVYQHGSFVVMRLFIEHCNTESILAEKLKVEEKKLKSVLSCLGKLSAMCCAQKDFDFDK